MTIARDHLSADGLGGEAELFRHIFLDLRVDVGKGSNRARDRAGGDLLSRRFQPRFAAGELRMGLRELEPESHGLGMDAVAAPDGGGIFVLFGTRLQRR
jgi:hypothetical protein